MNSSPKTRSLLDLKVNEEGQIFSFSSQLSHDYAMRLRELGFREGEFVKCLKTPPMGAPRIFEICGSVFSMETEIAQKIKLINPDNEQKNK
jgi:Fe2+ transport system protein FeoA